MFNKITINSEATLLQQCSPPRKKPSSDKKKQKVKNFPKTYFQAHRKCNFSFSCGTHDRGGVQIDNFSLWRLTPPPSPTSILCMTT